MKKVLKNVLFLEEKNKNTNNKQCMEQLEAIVVTQPAIKCQTQQKYQLLELCAKLQMLVNVPVYFYTVLYHNDAIENHPKKKFNKKF